MLLAGLPAVVVALLLLVSSELGFSSRVAVAMLVVGSWLGVSLAVRVRSRHHLRTVSNLVSAMREGDYSFRVRGGGRADPFGELITELNGLTQILRRQRVDDLEATALVRKVMAEIDVAVLAFDGSHRLRQVNAAGAQLLGVESSLLGRTAAELGLDSCLTGGPSRTVELEIGESEGRWEMRRGTFRQHGRPHHLLVLSDVSRTLRAEELEAWKRLIRVIGHEINNSLAPVMSIAGSMERLVNRDPLPDDWQDDLQRGLEVIASRTAALNRFMSAYSRLAKMPPPRPQPVDVEPCLRRVCELETRLPVLLRKGPVLEMNADQDQVEQLLINLVRNAVEASLETGGRVEARWIASGDEVEIVIRDQGPGLPDSANLFVPFFTTKQGGSGIGLFLCRQVAEAHGGSVTVSDREDGHGCVARVRLPLA